MKSKPVPQAVELSQEQFDQLMRDLEQFEDTFLKHLAESDRFEIIPTMTEDGQILTKEQIDLLIRECARLGLSPLYRIDVGNNVVVINPKSLKIGYITDEVH